MAQKYKVFTLAEPIEVEGRDPIKNIHVQRPKWGHIKRLMKAVSPDLEKGQADIRSREERQADHNQDIDAIDSLLMELCNVDADVFDQVEMEDILAIQDWIESFTKKFQSTGETS